MATLDERFARKAALADELAETFTASAPFMRFLCDALDVPF